MPPALAALTEDEKRAGFNVLRSLSTTGGALEPLVKEAPTRDPFSQIAVGAIRAPFTAVEQPLRALSAIPGLRGVFEPAAEAVAAIPPAPSGGILESGVESGLSFVLSTFGLQGLPLLSRVFTTVPRVTTGLLAIFGGAEFAETRKELEDINKTLPADQQIPTDDITRTALISGATEAVLEGIPIPVALRRILPGVPGGRGLTEQAAQAVGRAFGAPGGMLRETARRAAEVAAIEIPQEAATAAIQAAARESVLAPRGVPTPTPAQGALAAIAPTAVSSLVIGGVGRITQRPRAAVAPPQGQPAGDVAQAARPEVTPALAPIVAPPPGAPGAAQAATPGTALATGIPGVPRRQEATPATQAINPLTGEGIAPSVPPTPPPVGAGVVINPLTGEQVPLSPEDAARFEGTPLLGVRPRGEQALEGMPVGTPSPTEAAAQPAAAIAPLPEAQQAMLPDLVSALRNLGYTQRDATAAAQAALAQQPASLEDAIALALQPRAVAISRVEAPAALPPKPEGAPIPVSQPSQAQRPQPGIVPGTPSVLTPQAATPTTGPNILVTATPRGGENASEAGVEFSPGSTVSVADLQTAFEGVTPRINIYPVQGLTNLQSFVVQFFDETGRSLPVPQEFYARLGLQGPLRRGAEPNVIPGAALQSVATPAQGPLVDVTQLIEGERATQAQIERERLEAETGTRLRPPVEQAPSSGLFEQEQVLPLQEAPSSAQQIPAGMPPQRPALPHEAPALGRALADIYAGPLQRMTERGLTLTQMHTVIANELRERYGAEELQQGMQAVAGAGFAGDDALVRFIDNAIDQALGLPTEAESQQQALREGEEGSDILSVIRQPDTQGRSGIKVTKATGIEREFRDLVGVVEGGRRNVARLMNNRSGLTPQEMANRLADMGYLPEASEEALLDHLRERLGTGRPMGPRYQPGGLAEPLAFFSRLMRRPTPGGDRADATPTTKRQAAAIAARLQHIADGETIIATTMQAEPGRRVAIPGVRRREGTIEVARTIPPSPMVKEMRTTGSVAFEGQTIRPGDAGSRDIAVIGQLVRDPEVEHLHYILTDGAGRVVRVIEVSSRLPGSGAPFVKASGQPLGPGFMAKGMRDLQTKMRQAGATGLWMLHNHPSGNPTPSQADINFTRRLAAVPGFQGHVVIDSGRYATINAAGEQTIEPLEVVGPDPFLQPSLGVPFAEIPIKNTANAASVGRALSTPGFVALVLLNKRPTGTALGVRGVLLVPEGALTQPHDQIKAYIESLESEFGAVLATAYYDGTSPAVHTAAESLYRDGVLTDYVMALPGGAEVSITEEAPELAPDRRLVRARRLEAAAGERVEEPPTGQVEGFEQSKVVDADTGRLKPVYHGTAQMFGQFDPEKKGSAAGQMFSGFFFAENPRVASRYAKRASSPVTYAKDSQGTILEFPSRSDAQAYIQQHPNLGVNVHVQQDTLKEGNFLLLEDARTSANIRPVYLNITTPFIFDDLDSDEEAMTRIATLASRYAKNGLVVSAEDLMGEDIHAFMESLVEDYGLTVPEVTQVLQAAGYDGIFHEGRRDGKVWVAFSPDQIHAVFSPRASFPPGLGGGVAEEAPTLPTRQPATLDIPNTIQGVTVAQAGKLATAYRMMFDVGHSLHSSHIQRPLSQATFQKLRIRWEQMEDIGQQMLLRFMQHPEDLDAIRRRLQQDPTAGLSTAENAGLVQWTMVMMDDLDVKRSLGEVDQATFDQEWDAIIKNALLIPAAASSAGRTLAMQRRFQQVGGYTITDFLRREERARGRALTDEEKRQKVGDFFDVLRTGDRDQIRDRLEKEADPTLLDYYWEAYYGSLLSGLPTLNVNTFGTLAHITFQKFVVGPTAVGLDWMISAFSGQERQRYMREVFADFNATWKDAGQQYREAWYWWKSPFPQGIGGGGQLAQPAGALRQGFALTRGGMRLDAGSGADAWMRAQTQNADGTPNRLGPVMRRLAPFVGAASRVMAATDAVATNLAFQGEVAKLSTREGIRRFGIQNRQQVDNFVTHVQTHLVQYPEIESAAKAVAQADTFNDPAGHLARALLGARRAPQPFGFFFRLLTPFANTPDRLLARGAELVPGLGLVIGYREAGLTYTGWLADFREGDPKAVEVAAKQVVGLMLASMAALLWDKDLLTGPLPTEPQERQAWERQGKLPFAIRMGDNWVEYRRVEPFISAPFGALTAGLQAIKTMRENRLKQGLTLDYSYMDDASSVAAGIAFNMSKFILDSSYFSGLASFFESTSRTSQGFATGLTQQLVSATLPLSGLLRNLNRTIEASGMLGTEPGVVLMRQRERVGEQYLRSIPGAAAGVRPRLDVFGQPVVSERPLLGAVGGLLSPIRRQVAQEDPVEAVFERLQFRPGRPPRRQLETVVGRRIEDEEYDAYAERRGTLARETIERIVGLPFFGELQQDKQLARLKQAFSQATRRARREVFGRPETTEERRTRFADAALAAASGE